MILIHTSGVANRKYDCFLPVKDAVKFTVTAK